MKRRKLLNRSADFKFDKVGYVTGMCYEMSSPIVYLKKIVKHINETKLIGKLQMEMIVHDVEKLTSSL